MGLIYQRGHDPRSKIAMPTSITQQTKTRQSITGFLECFHGSVPNTRWILRRQTSISESSAEAELHFLKAEADKVCHNFITGRIS